jgi:hypothetical protein
VQVHTRKDAKYSLKASYLEIYNEGVYDLVHFNPKAKSLPVKWDASYGFYVQGLKVVPCSQQRTMMEVRTPLLCLQETLLQLFPSCKQSHLAVWLLLVVVTTLAVNTNSCTVQMLFSTVLSVLRQLQLHVPADEWMCL